MKQVKKANVDADMYATLESLNDDGVRNFAHSLIDALCGSPDQQTLKLFLAGQKKAVKQLALGVHTEGMRRRENSP